MRFHFEELLRYLKAIERWPWTRLFFVAMIGFVAASAFSLIVAMMMLPDLKTLQSVRPTTQIVSDMNWVSETLTQAQIDRILKRNIFNQEGKFPDDDAEEDEEGKEIETKLPLQLLGVISGGTLYNGIAIVKNTSNNTVDSYMVDDLIQPHGVPVIEIYPKKVYIQNGKRREFMRLDEKPIVRTKRIAKAQTGTGLGQKMGSDNEYREDGLERIGSNIRITDSYRQNLLTSQLPQVLQDAKAEPQMVGGELIGWRMVNIKKGSIYEKLGMQNGDVVREINGVPLTDAGKAIKTLNKMRNETKYQVKIERNGTPMDVSLNVSE